MRRRAWLLAIAGFGALACVYVALTGSLGDFPAVPGGDYPGPACHGCDAAGPPLVALVHGHLSAFFSRQPIMGSASLLLRAPFLAIVTWLHGDYVAQYRVGVLVCLLAALLLLAPALHLMLRRGQRPAIVLLLVAVVCLGPATFKEIVWGHPEESFGAALAVGAVVAAARDRAVTAGILVGLAMATKQWGVFALLPVLMLCQGQRRRVLVAASGVLLVLVLPMFLVDPARFLDQNLRTAVADLGVTPTNLWWVFHSRGLDPNLHLALNVIPSSLDSLTHVLAFGLALALPLLYWRRRSGRDPYDALQLLALLFLLRCVLDPLATSYHHAPFLLAIAVFEGLSRRGLPVVTLISTAVLLGLNRIVLPLNQPDVMNAVYLAWALPTLAYLSASQFRRGESDAAALLLPREASLALPA